MKKIIISILAVGILGIAYWLISPLWRTVELKENAPTVPVVNVVENKDKMAETMSGIFKNGAHDVSGQVKVLETTPNKTLRFENFSTINGPDLYVYLATDEKATDFINLGKNKATQGNINYSIPSGTDLSKYKFVLIWCKSFSVNFGTAVLH